MSDVFHSCIFFVEVIYHLYQYSYFIHLSLDFLVQIIQAAKAGGPDVTSNKQLEMVEFMI